MKSLLHVRNYREIIAGIYWVFAHHHKRNSILSRIQGEMTPTLCFTNEIHKSRSRNVETVNHEARPYRIYFGNSGASATFQFLFSVSLVFVSVTSVNLLKKGLCASFGGWQTWGEGVGLFPLSACLHLYTGKRVVLGKARKSKSGQEEESVEGEQAKAKAKEDSLGLRGRNPYVFSIWWK